MANRLESKAGTSSVWEWWIAIVTGACIGLIATVVMKYLGTRLKL